MFSTVSPMERSSPSTHETMPIATEFSNPSGRTAFYYFKNNPWTSTSGRQKVYRYCIICGDDRFSNSSWSAALKNTFSMLGASLSVCNRPSCHKAFSHCSAFVPSHMQLVKTPLDQQRFQNRKGNQFFEEVEDTTFLDRDDRIYASEADMPKEHQEMLKQLEQLSAGERIAAIDHIDFAYRKQHLMPPYGENNDSIDPFLRFLAAYRNKTCQKYLTGLSQDQEVKSNL